MKPRKAIKKLMRAEALLSSVSELYAATDRRVRDYVDAAKDAAVRARDAVKRELSRPSKNRRASAKQQQLKSKPGRPRSRNATKRRSRSAAAKRPGN